jgi:diguanylate cyclase (GGDEF)-like protein/PAS domain S-box-containing protein
MVNRAELLEAALDSFPNGIALLDGEGRVLFWNRAAEAITGYAGMDLLSRPLPEQLLLDSLGLDAQAAGVEEWPEGESMVRFQHKMGHEMPVIAQKLVLRDGLGGRIGTGIVFHPAESLDALPHGECSEDSGAQSSLDELEMRLGAALGDYSNGGLPFGVLWITVDQAHGLRKTHGAGACEAMLEKMGRVLTGGLRPAEAMGRWGDDEFLVLSHERTAEMLAAHAQVLAGLARTADFRWWGDRISLTVSIGAAQAERNGTQAETLAELLARAKKAMTSSFHAGGNQITSAPGRQTCLPS